MSKLIYSVLRYEPSIVSGEKINLGIAFSHPEDGLREFHHISKWTRVSAFDDTLNIPLLRDLMLDIRDAMGTPLTNPDFDLEKFRLHYCSEIYFDDCEEYEVTTETLSETIEFIKSMYFQFELDADKRPNKDEQKKFLRHLLVARKIKYKRNFAQSGKYGDKIVYDYQFGNYGVIFFNFNLDEINNKIMNKVKAWAWNAINAPEGMKIIVLYDLAEENRGAALPAIDILNAAAYRAINIHDGFSAVSDILEKVS